MRTGFLAEMSLLKRGTYDELQRLARLHPALVDRAELEAVVEKVVDDRLRFARSFLAFASTIVVVPTMDETDARNAISRSYYAVHHAGRALVLFTTRDDPFGHIETANAVEATARKDAAVRAVLGQDP